MSNSLLMHAAGANTGGEIGSVVAAAVMLSVLKGKPDELLAIFDSFSRETEYVLAAPARPFLLQNLTQLFQSGRTTGNGRFVRNVFQRCVEIQSKRVARTAEKSRQDLNTLALTDIAGALEEVLAEK